MMCSPERFGIIYGIAEAMTAKSARPQYKVFAGVKYRV
jgi:hypothetical protein